MIEAPSTDDHDAYRAYCDEHGWPYVPGFVQRMPLYDGPFALCPCCNYVFRGEAVPRGREAHECPACSDRFWIRTAPDGVTRTVNETAMIEIECLEAERDPYVDMVTMSVVPAGHESVAAREQVELVRRARRQARERVLAKHGRLTHR